jgi:hypothetical protein
MLLDRRNTTSCEKTCSALPIHHAAQRPSRETNGDRGACACMQKEEGHHDGISAKVIRLIHKSQVKSTCMSVHTYNKNKLYDCACAADSNMTMRPGVLVLDGATGLELKARRTAGLPVAYVFD